MSAAPLPGPYTLGDKDSSWGNGGIWVDLDAPSHGGFARVVWTMEDDVLLKQTSPQLEATAYLLANSFGLLQALERLSAAALARDNVMGDPCALLAAKAELADANRVACAVIAQARGQS